MCLDFIRCQNRVVGSSSNGDAYVTTSKLPKDLMVAYRVVAYERFQQWALTGKNILG